MDSIFGVPTSALTGQVVIGLINGAFYSLMSLGLAIIFGMLHVVNFAHGAQYMMGAFVAWGILEYFGLGYWWALVVAPVVMGLLGLLMERIFLRHLYAADHVYALLLTFGVALLLEGAFRLKFGISGQPYPNPLSGGLDLGVSFIPWYRLWVIAVALAVSLGTWWFIDRTKIGSYLRAANENPNLVRTFGINVPRMLMLTYGFGVALAGFAGVMAAPIYQVSPHMGANLIIVVFAVVVIGGMGSILGSIVTGFGLGLLEGMTKLFAPDYAGVAIFIVMILTLAFRPSGLFGRSE
ncbi:branched-chain amino acid ABC transporter permease [Ramlibacter sp. 2FC]|uniref:branched-chain amino acid ABC transporter permease n=1 Tax=Ramlibacter sp. 2FC TaxID=2502188 RepID=UPI0010F670C7|nr:branched-chain amino acid ABC transporter permease [Ramlibacter sp. 2FC]